MPPAPAPSPWWASDNGETRVRLYHGHAPDVLRRLPAESVHTVITSPPYYHQRDFGLPPQLWGGDPSCAHAWDRPRGGRHGATCARCGGWLGQLGLEPTADAYLAHMVEIFREVRRVLHRTGTLWLNISDSYTDKQLLGIPWRLALALQADGWVLRAEIVWAKALSLCPTYSGSALPEDVDDRPVRSHRISHQEAPGFSPGGNGGRVSAGSPPTRAILGGVRRVNIYRLMPDPAQRRLLREVADRCAALWNVAQYRCRQAFFAGARVPSYAGLCSALGGHAAYRALPSDIAQETLKKVAESWTSYRRLRRAHGTDSYPHTPGLPGYWKDRRTGHRLPKCIPLKCPRAYRVSPHDVAMVMPNDLAPGRLVLPFRGQTRWDGKAGRAEISYDVPRRRFYLHVSVTVPEPERTPRPEKWAAIDPGARMTIAVAVDGEPEASLYRSRELWKDFQYWNRQIAALQQQLAQRGLHTSRRLRRCYQRRQARLAAAYRALARTIVDHLKRSRVTDLALEDQTGIRQDLNFGRTNALIHNFWAFAKLAQALRDACERGASASIRCHAPRALPAAAPCARTGLR